MTDSTPSPSVPPTARIRYRCRGCALEFTDATTSNAHYDATGHYQTSNCRTCGEHLSWHTDAEYAACLAGVSVPPAIPENVCGLCYHDKSESATCTRPDCEQRGLDLASQIERRLWRQVNQHDLQWVMREVRALTHPSPVSVPPVSPERSVPTEKQAVDWVCDLSNTADYLRYLAPRTTEPHALRPTADSSILISAIRPIP